MELDGKICYNKFMAKKLTKQKAKIMLEEGKAHGRSLTKKQKRFFGFVSGGGKPTKTMTKKRGRFKKRKSGY